MIPTSSPFSSGFSFGFGDGGHTDLFPYGVPGIRYGDFSGRAQAAVAAITGTAVAGGVLESEIVAGGETIIITLGNDTWAAAGAAFNAVRQAIIDGLDSDGVEATGWNTEVRDNEVVGAVVRTSDTVVTITLSAAASYSVASDETITVTVPASALVTSAIDVTGTPTFTVTAEAPAVVTIIRNPSIILNGNTYSETLASCPNPALTLSGKTYSLKGTL